MMILYQCVIGIWCVQGAITLPHIYVPYEVYAQEHATGRRTELPFSVRVSVPMASGRPATACWDPRIDLFMWEHFDPDTHTVYCVAKDPNAAVSQSIKQEENLEN